MKASPFGILSKRVLSVVPGDKIRSASGISGIEIWRD